MVPRSTFAFLRSPFYNDGVRIASHKKSVVFLVLGVSLIVLAMALNVGWILLNWR